jgi:hypothetical protein
MATSGTTAFNLDLTELVEEAFERCGAELRSGYDLKTARRSLNLLFADWANRGLNMWTFEQGTIPLIPGQNTYALPNDTVDLLEHVIRTGAGNVSTQSDLAVTRISISTYSSIPNKLTQARPIQVVVQRMSGQDGTVGALVTAVVSATATTISLDNVNNLPAAGFIRLGNEVLSYGYITPTANSTAGTLNNCGRAQQNTLAATHAIGDTVYLTQVPAFTVWPTPDNSQAYQFVYWRLRRTQDAGGGVNVMDVPFRFIPCMVAGLAYYLSMKLPNALDRMQVLKAQYDEAWDLASTEDREKAAVRFVPRQMFIS